MICAKPIVVKLTIPGVAFLRRSNSFGPHARKAHNNIFTDLFGWDHGWVTSVT